MTLTGAVGMKANSITQSDIEGLLSCPGNGGMCGAALLAERDHFETQQSQRGEMQLLKPLPHQSQSPFVVALVQMQGPLHAGGPHRLRTGSHVTMVMRALPPRRPNHVPRLRLRFVRQGEDRVVLCAATARRGQDKKCCQLAGRIAQQFESRPASQKVKRGLRLLNPHSLPAPIRPAAAKPPRKADYRPPAPQHAEATAV